MPITTGFNHVATLTTDMDATVRFYERAFDATVTFEIPERDDHPWMKILDLGGGAALNVFEVPAVDIVGERRRQGHRGAIDHYALAVDSRATLETVRERLAAAGAQEVGEIQRLGDEWSLFFRDPDGMELEVCCAAEDGSGRTPRPHEQEHGRRPRASSSRRTVAPARSGPDRSPSTTPPSPTSTVANGSAPEKEQRS